MTQVEKLERHLEKHGHITPMKAMNIYGIQRLAARVEDLRKLRSRRYRARLEDYYFKLGMWSAMRGGGNPYPTRPSGLKRIVTVTRQDEAGGRFTEYQLENHPNIAGRNGATLFDGARFLGARKAA